MKACMYLGLFEENVRIYSVGTQAVLLVVANSVDQTLDTVRRLRSRTDLPIVASVLELPPVGARIGVDEWLVPKASSWDIDKTIQKVARRTLQNGTR